VNGCFCAINAGAHTAETHKKAPRILRIVLV
jgi:hypothetical protein